MHAAPRTQYAYATVLSQQLFCIHCRHLRHNNSQHQRCYHTHTHNHHHCRRPFIIPALAAVSALTPLPPERPSRHAPSHVATQPVMQRPSHKRYSHTSHVTHHTACITNHASRITHRATGIRRIRTRPRRPRCRRSRRRCSSSFLRIRLHLPTLNVQRSTVTHHPLCTRRIISQVIPSHRSVVPQRLVDST